MATGTFTLVLFFAFSANMDFSSDSRSAVASIDSQKFPGYESLEKCNDAADTLGRALADKYWALLGNVLLRVRHSHLCLENNEIVGTGTK